MAHKNKKSNCQRDLVLLSIGFAVLVAIPIGITWFAFALGLYFGNGGNFGGYGSAPADAEPWVYPLQLASLLLAVLLVIIIGIRFYVKNK